ncbi:MAG: N-acetyltransferase [Proteobacteria bacterium]|jgi:predicted GNAT family acetyltransferase|nr:N-acetyltransferase [Pseudomonadota bacterium]
MPGKITHSEAGDRGVFALEQGGRQVAEMTYQRLGEARILVDHTHVDPAVRGHGVARQLLDAAVAWARQTNTKISASCSYVVVQFARDASLRDVQDKID